MAEKLFKWRQTGDPKGEWVTQTTFDEMTADMDFDSMNEVDRIKAMKVGDTIKIGNFYTIKRTR